MCHSRLEAKTKGFYLILFLSPRLQLLLQKSEEKKFSRIMAAKETNHDDFLHDSNAFGSKFW